MKKMMLAVIAIAFFSPAFAQTNDTTAIKQVIGKLFEGMQKGDTAMVHACFDATARLQTAVVKRSGIPGLLNEPLDSFLVHISRLTANTSLKTEERALSYEIRIDDLMATAWVPYEFYVNETLSHTGVNAFQLYKSSEGWRIIQICDTRKRRK